MKKINLSKGKVACVDDTDYDWLSRHKWYYAARGYAARDESVNGERVRLKMHRVILKSPGGVEVDHINGDSLDNQRANLRACTHRQNMKNMKRHRDGSSRWKGVSWDASRNKWVAQIHATFIGRFRDETKAAEAYDEAARKAHGEYAALNFPREGEQSALGRRRRDGEHTTL